MFKTTLGIALVFAIVGPAMAGDRPTNGKSPKLSAIPVGKLLEQFANSPAGGDGGESEMLRAVADLIEKERLADHSDPATPALHASENQSDAGAFSKPPLRLMIHLKNVPAEDACEKIEKRFQVPNVRPAGCSGKVVVVVVPVCNGLLVSAPPEEIDAIKKLLAELDVRPAMVVLQVRVARLLPARSTDVAGGKPAEQPLRDKEPSMTDDGAAWWSWAQRHGRLEVLLRPMVMTLDNQPAMIQMHSAWRLEVTPHTTGEDKIDVDLRVKLGATVLNAIPSLDLKSGNVKATISAKNGQTIVVDDLPKADNEGHDALVIAITPKIVTE